MIGLASLCQLVERRSDVDVRKLLTFGRIQTVWPIPVSSTTVPAAVFSSSGTRVAASRVPDVAEPEPRHDFVGSREPLANT